VKDSRSEHTGHNLNARLLRFRSQPGSEDAYALAEDLIGAQRYGDARSVTVGAQPKDHEDGGLLVLEGRAWLLERDMVRAQAVLLRAVRASPELAEAYRWLGYVLLKRGDPQRAAKTLHRALELDPNDAEAAKLATRSEY
jgi:Flp pilus assembly protein TadD